MSFLTGNYTLSAHVPRMTDECGSGPMPLDKIQVSVIGDKDYCAIEIKLPEGLMMSILPGAEKLLLAAAQAAVEARRRVVEEGAEPKDVRLVANADGFKENPFSN